MNVLKTEINNSNESSLFAFTGGIEWDKRLAPFEIKVQKAWAEALAEADCLTADEQTTACTLLDRALTRMEDGSFDWRIEDEDIHMNIERFLTDEGGEIGRKIHAGRSRNDLIATTLRLFVQAKTESVSHLVANLSSALCDIAASTAETIVPGTTHLQHGQPVSFGHIAAAHAQGLAGDIRRLTTASQQCLDQMPLGSAALAGTSLEIDLNTLADALGFCAPAHNSYAAVGDRDFMIEAMDAFASVAVHIGRLCADIIHWSSTAVGLVRLPHDYSTGSSIMPNKRNPDIAELARARCTRVISLTQEAHQILSGVPTSYGSDLHELKKTFITSLDEIEAILTACTPFVAGLSVDDLRAAQLLERGHILATEIADALTAQGTSFREAYRITAALVEMADMQGLQVHALPEKAFRTLLPEHDLSFLENLSFSGALAKRHQPGGTAIACVREEIEQLRDRIQTSRLRP